MYTCFDKQVATLQEHWRVLPPYECPINSEGAVWGWSFLSLEFCRRKMSLTAFDIISFIYYALFRYIF